LCRIVYRLRGARNGLSQAGFKSLRLPEWDRHAVANVEHNKRNGALYVRDWPIYCEDVRHVDWSPYSGPDLVAGGPPCQPFSVGGRHRGNEDERDMWPEAVRVVRETQPLAFVFENVRGLKRAAFFDYLRWVTLSLSCPNTVRRPGEDAQAHLQRLEVTKDDATYDVEVHSVNAADYGAAQKRHRVIIIGIRRDAGIFLPRLSPTHSRERLLWDQWISREYWKRHGLDVTKFRPSSIDEVTIGKIRAERRIPAGLPWLTIRDAVGDSGDPRLTQVPIANHTFQPGARSYPRHTGSSLDMPAKALKAGVHGVPGGENMMCLPDGTVRYFTVREAARLQGLPDEYEFIGAWSENMR